MTSRGRKVGYLIYCDRMIGGPASPGAGGSVKGRSLAEMLDSAERVIITSAMKDHGDKRKAAASLGITSKTLESKAKKLGIKI